MPKKEINKRILLMVPSLHQGGMEKVCILTADMLKKKYDVYIAIFSEKNLFYKPENVEIINIHSEVKNGHIRKIINVFLRIHKIRKIKKQKKIDITMSFGSTAGLVNVLAKYRDKTISAIHGYNLLSEKSRMTVISKLSDAVVCCSKEITEEFQKMYGSRKLLTLYNPYDIEDIEKKSYEDIEEEHKGFFDSTDKIIVTMSREDDFKGFWHLIKIFALLRKRTDKVRLVMIGDGDFSDYKKLAHQLGVDSKILFTGLQKNPFSYLRLCDVYVMTSISEGLPNGLIEAMAVGLPIISTNCKSGPAEILHADYMAAAEKEDVFAADYGLLMPKLNPQKNLNPDEIESGERIFAEQLYEFLNNSEELAVRREQSLKRSEFFRAERYEERLVDILENL